VSLNLHDKQLDAATQRQQLRHNDGTQKNVVSSTSWQPLWASQQLHRTAETGLLSIFT